MASGQNFVFYAKEQVWLGICVDNWALYTGSGSKKWDGAEIVWKV